MVSATFKASLALSAILMAATASVSQAAYTIYQDNFDGTAGVLSGRALTVATGTYGGTAAAVWNSDAAPIVGGNPDAVWTTSGGTSATIGDMATGIDANLITNAYLPFTPQSGYIYDLHLAIQPSTVGSSGNWLGLAFAASGLNGHTAGGVSSALSNNNPVGLFISKGSGTVQFFSSGTSNGQSTTVATGVFNDYDILLDTTAANWKLTWMINGAVVGTPYTFTANPSIGNVIFGTNKLTGAVSGFQLTASEVPEPASLGLLGLGVAGLVARRRR